MFGPYGVPVVIRFTTLNVGLGESVQHLEFDEGVSARRGLAANVIAHLHELGVDRGFFSRREHAILRR